MNLKYSSGRISSSPENNTPIIPELFDLSKRKNQLILLLIVLFYTGISFFYLDKIPILYIDEALFNEPCANFLKEGTFANRLFPPYGRFDISNLFQGRIFSILQAMIFKIMGSNVISMRLQPFLGGLATLLLTFLITKKLFKNNSIAVIASFLLALSHQFVFASHISRPDMTVCIFILGSVLLFLEAQEREKSVLFFLSGLTAALAIDAHPPGNIAVFILLGLTVHQVLSKMISWKAAFFICIGLSAGILSWITWHILIDPALYFEQRDAIRFYSVYRLFSIPIIKAEWHRWYTFFWEGAYHRNMFLLILFAFSFFHAIRNHKETGYQTIMILFSGGFLGLMLAAPNKTSWYLIYVYPFLIMLTSGVLYRLYYSSVSYRKMVIVTLALGMISFLTLENLSKLRFYSANYNSYIERVKNYIPKDTVVLAHDNYWLGLKDHSQFVGHYLILQRHLFKKKRIPSDFYVGTLEDFLRRQKIQYIVADEELLAWIPDRESLHLFIRDHGELIGEFTDPFYGFSIYLTKKSPRPLVTKIYRVKN